MVVYVTSTSLVGELEDSEDLELELESDENEGWPKSASRMHAHAPFRLRGRVSRTGVESGRTVSRVTLKGKWIVG